MPLSMKPVHRYVTVVTVVGLCVFAAVVATSFDLQELTGVHFWVFALCVIGGELLPVRVPRRTQVLTITVSGPFTLALLLTHGTVAAILALATASAIDDLIRRKPAWKVGFNISQYSIAVATGGAILPLLSDLPRAGGRFDPIELPAILAAGAAFFAVNWAVTGIGIALAERAPIMRSFRTNVGLQTTTDGVMLTLTPILMAAADYSPTLIPLLAVPMIAVYRSANTSLKNLELADRLTSLYDATRISHGSTEMDDLLQALMGQAREIFRAESAAITLFPKHDGDSALKATLLQDGRLEPLRPVDLNPTEGVWARVASEGVPLLISKSVQSHKLARYLYERDIRDAMVAPLYGSDHLIGIVEVCNRVGEGSTFGEDDLRLFETLANHAGISLENARLVSALEESLEHLTEMNQLKDDFVASVSHELRTPLTSIKGYVKTLLRPGVEFEPEEHRLFLETIDRQSNRLQRLIEDLLAVSLIDSTSRSTVTDVVALPELTAEVLDELRDRVEGCDIVVSLDDDIPAITTDPGKIHQILLNLIDNALKYAPESDAITIEGHRQGEGVAMMVADQGEGIDPDAQDKIFDRFYQVDQSATRKAGGTGLGLYICRRMSDAIGGRVWLERSDARGSVFGLWVPLAAPHRAERRAPARRA